MINRPLFPITKLSKIEFFSMLYDKKIYIYFFRIGILSFPINKIFRNFLLLHFPFKTPSLAVFLHSQIFFSLMSRKIKFLFKDLYKDRELCLPFFLKHRLKIYCCTPFPYLLYSYICNIVRKRK